MTPHLSRAAEPAASPITWERARIVGLDRPKGTATTGPLELAAETPAIVGLLLEGTRDRLPVYCCELSKLRIEGRAIPDRMIVTPADAGLTDADIQWGTLRPGTTIGTWQSERFDQGAKKWTIEVLDLPGEPPAGVAPPWGTVRFVAAIRVARPDGKSVLLETKGWAGKGARNDADGGPGFVLSRGRSATLDGQALSFARLPVKEGITPDLTRARIALSPDELVLGAVEELARVNVPRPSQAAPLDSPEWSWLFESVHRGIHRRKTPDAPLVDASGRPVAHREHASAEQDVTRSGDVLLLEGRIAILEEDDGDDWLDEGDMVVHTALGTPSRGPLSAIEGQSVDILRVRSFLEFRENLRRAGHSEMGKSSPHLGADVFRASAEFQRAHRLHETGLPDSITVRAVQELVQRMPAAGASDTPRAAPDSAQASGSSR